MEIQFKLHGVEGIVDRLSTFPSKLQKRALRSAVRKGANVLKDAVIAGAERIDDPYSKEAIYKNVSVQFSSKQSKREGGVVMRVGIRGGARQYAPTKDNVRSGKAGLTYKTGGDSANPGGDTWYWRLVEFGTSRTQARPFVRPAFEARREQASAVLVAELNRQIDRLASSKAAE